jgi:hypothetical protein
MSHTSVLLKWWMNIFQHAPSSGYGECHRLFRILSRKLPGMGRGVAENPKHNENEATTSHYSLAQHATGSLNATRPFGNHAEKRREQIP